MSLQLDWFGLVEGAAFDLSGRATFVSFSPQALVSQTFPAVVSPAFVFVVWDDEEPEPILRGGSQVTIRFETQGPDGETILLVQQQLDVAEKTDPRLKNRVQAIAQLPIQAAKSGIYTISAELSVSGSSEALRVSRTIPVLEPLQA